MAGLDGCIGVDGLAVVGVAQAHGKPRSLKEIGNCS